VWKVVRSAAANAENNYGLDPDNLVVAAAFADMGPSLPMRYRAKARGMAGPIEKKTTHITVIVDDEVAPRRRRK
jgi:large subunit ribosomal protein L22